MAARKFDQARLDQLVEVAKADPHAYRVLEGRFKLSASVARTLVVGSGLSKSRPEVTERERARIARWLEQGHIGPPKAKPKPAKLKAEPEVVVVDEPQPEAIDAEKAARKRGQRKDGQASPLAREIASAKQ